MTSPSDRGPAWFRRRARNVPERRLFLAASGTITFIVALIGLVVVPSRAKRQAAALTPSSEQYNDTITPLQALSTASAELQRALSALARARQLARRTATAAIQTDTVSGELRSRRRVLGEQSAELGRLLDRVRNAPLPESYRALGGATALRDEPRVQQLLDSLAEIERNREAFGAVGGVDPIFIALTERAGEIGRALQTIAADRRDMIRAELDALMPAPPARPEIALAPSVDTMPLVLAAAAAESRINRAERDVARARTYNKALEDRAATARAILDLSASPIALLTASLVLGLAAGFALTMLAEIRQPRLADAAEAEAITGARVLAEIRSSDVPPDRSRRQADQLVPPLVNRGSDSYEQLFTFLASEPEGVRLLAVTGEDPIVTAIIAMNLAAVAAFHAHSCLLVDTDFDMQSVASVARVRPAPGVAEFLARQMAWAESVRPILVGRDRSVDVLPAGRFGGRGTLQAAMDEFRREITYLGRRYDTVVISTPASRHGTVAAVGGAAGSVLLCLRTGRSSIGVMKTIIRELREHDATIRGIVLWGSPDPAFEPPPAS